MKITRATPRHSTAGTSARASRGAAGSRAAREKAELAMTHAQRLTLALELSDLCESLAAAGRRALRTQA